MLHSNCRVSVMVVERDQVHVRLRQDYLTRAESCCPIVSQSGGDPNADRLLRDPAASRKIAWRVSPEVAREK